MVTFIYASLGEPTARLTSNTDLPCLHSKKLYTSNITNWNAGRKIRNFHSSVEFGTIGSKDEQMPIQVFIDGTPCRADEDELLATVLLRQPKPVFR
ncbi:MAG: hypothetical protein NXI02_21145, partial [Rhodobacteraceae bacterium]|nr:hypothetical protein [Paracoccaceae bacterium]